MPEPARTNGKTICTKKNQVLSDGVRSETLEDTLPSLIITTDDVHMEESWLNNKIISYRSQRATLKIKSRIAKMEEFSKYLVSPLRKSYWTFYYTIMICFKALQCWLSLKPTSKAPNGWVNKRNKIMNRMLTSEAQPSMDAPLRNTNVADAD